LEVEIDDFHRTEEMRLEVRATGKWEAIQTVVSRE
jgi:hypothetical protein